MGSSECESPELLEWWPSSPPARCYCYQAWLSDRRAWSCSPSLNAGTWSLLTSLLPEWWYKPQVWKYSEGQAIVSGMSLPWAGVIGNCESHQGHGTLGSHVKMNYICFCVGILSLPNFNNLCASVLFRVYSQQSTAHRKHSFSSKSLLWAINYPFLRDKGKNYAHNLFSLLLKDFPCRSISKSLLL